MSFVKAVAPLQRTDEAAAHSILSPDLVSLVGAFPIKFHMSDLKKLKATWSTSSMVAIIEWFACFVEACFDVTVAASATI